MRSLSARFCVPRLSAILTLAGCGGSSNNNSSGGNGGGGGGGGQSSSTVTYNFIIATPTAVATQMGTSAYQAATLQSNKLTLTIPSGTTNYSIAYACPSVVIEGFTSNEEFIVQRSTLDGTAFTEGCFSPTPSQVGLATVQVDPSAIPGAAFVGITQDGSTSPLLWSGGALSLSAPMATGTTDMFVVAYDSTGQYPLAVRILRSQTVPGPLNGGNTVVFTTADETTKQPITYNNLPAGSPGAIPQVTYYTSSGDYLQLLTDLSAVPATQYPALPAAALQNGDYYTFLFTALSGPVGGAVGVESAASSGSPQALTFPSTWTYAGPAAAVLPTFNFNYTGFSASQPLVQTASIDGTLGVSQVNPFGTSYDFIQVSATANYQNGATTLAIPDLTALAGFVPSPAAGASVDWSAGITQGSGFESTPPTGTVQTVENSGTYTAP